MAQDIEALARNYDRIRLKQIGNSLRTTAAISRSLGGPENFDQHFEKEELWRGILDSPDYIGEYNKRLGSKLEDDVNLDKLFAPKGIRRRTRIASVIVINRSLRLALNAGIQTVGELRRKSEEELQRVRGIGVGSAHYLFDGFRRPQSPTS